MGQSAAFGNFNQFSETQGIGYGDLGQNLPVEKHLRLFQTADEFAVRKTRKLDRRADAEDPKTAKIPLFETPILEGVLETFIHGLLGGTEKGRATSAISAGLFQDLFSSSAGFKAPFCSGHDAFPFYSFALAKPDAH